MPNMSAWERGFPGRNDSLALYQASHQPAPVFHHLCSPLFLNISDMSSLSAILTRKHLLSYLSPKATVVPLCVDFVSLSHLFLLKALHEVVDSLHRRREVEKMHSLRSCRIGLLQQHHHLLR